MCLWFIEFCFSKFDKVFVVCFDNEVEFLILFEILCVESLSVEVQGYFLDQKVIVIGKENVFVIGVELVGCYVVWLIFDDGYDSGLFIWDYFYVLGEVFCQFVGDVYVYIFFYGFVVNNCWIL